MVDDIEQRIYDLVRPYAGVYVFKRKPVSLTPDTDLDTDLSIDELEIEDLMNDFFKEFSVQRGNFNIKNYFPDVPFSFNPFKKQRPYLFQISL